VQEQRAQRELVRVWLNTISGKGWPSCWCWSAYPRRPGMPSNGSCRHAGKVRFRPDADITHTLLNTLSRGIASSWRTWSTTNTRH